MLICVGENSAFFEFVTLRHKRVSYRLSPEFTFETLTGMNPCFVTCMARAFYKFMFLDAGVFLLLNYWSPTSIH